MFCIAGWLPGHIAKSRWHPWGEVVTVAGWVTLICGFALWPVALMWAFVDVPPARRSPEPVRNDRGRCSASISCCCLRWCGFGLIRFNPFWKVSPLIVLLLLNLGLFIPMGWGAPQGSALVFRNAVSIVPM